MRSATGYPASLNPASDHGDDVAPDHGSGLTMIAAPSPTTTGGDRRGRETGSSGGKRLSPQALPSGNGTGNLVVVSALIQPRRLAARRIGNDWRKNDAPARSWLSRSVSRIRRHRETR